jgi:hypothetical protein
LPEWFTVFIFRKYFVPSSYPNYFPPLIKQIVIKPEIMEEKSEKGNPKSETINGKSSQDHFPEDSHAPRLQTINNKPETSNMEVHHHPLVEKNNFKEYFLKF